MGSSTVLLGLDTKENRFSEVMIVKNKLLCLVLSQILPASYSKKKPAVLLYLKTHFNFVNLVFISRFLS